MERPVRDIDALTALALDSTRPIAERLAAIDALVEQVPEAAKPVMLTLAERATEPSAVLEASGMALARIEHGGLRVSEFDMRDMSEVAFIAFDEWRPPPDPMNTKNS